MTTRYAVFDSPLLLGFDHLERMVERATKASQNGYPPYNIEQIGEHGLRITLAVAGFTMEQLHVAIEDRNLVIRGRQEEEDKERFFIHRGIATRQFQRLFLLSDDIEVRGAFLDNGLLHIDLVRLLPDKKVQTIPIQTNAAKRGNAPMTPMAIGAPTVTAEKTENTTGEIT